MSVKTFTLPTAEEAKGMSTDKACAHLIEAARLWVFGIDDELESRWLPSIGLADKKPFLIRLAGERLQLRHDALWARFLQYAIIVIFGTLAIFTLWVVRIFHEIPTAWVWFIVLVGCIVIVVLFKVLEFLETIRARERFCFNRYGYCYEWPVWFLKDASRAATLLGVTTFNFKRNTYEAPARVQLIKMATRVRLAELEEAAKAGNNGIEPRSVIEQIKQRGMWIEDLEPPKIEREIFSDAREAFRRLEIAIPTEGQIFNVVESNIGELKKPVVVEEAVST